MPYSSSQSTLSRAWADTRSSFHKILFFWVVEVIAAGSGIFIGTIVTPEDAGRIISATYPAIGGLIGILAGFSIIFIINLILAPYRQRNEARKRLIELESESEDKKQRAQLRQDIGVLITEGTEVLKGFKSVRTFGDALPTEEFKIWREKGYEILLRHGLNTEYSLWFRDVGINIDDSVLADYKSACEAGLDRLEDILKTLRD